LQGDEVGAKRRRRAVLDAVNAALQATEMAASPPEAAGLPANDLAGRAPTAAVQGPIVADVAAPTPTRSAPPMAHRRAANEAQWRSGPAWWRGAAAACILVTSTLLVVHELEGGPGSGFDKGRETPPAAAAGTGRKQVRVDESDQRAEAPALPPTVAKAAPPPAAQALAPRAVLDTTTAPAPGAVAAPARSLSIGDENAAAASIAKADPPPPPPTPTTTTTTLAPPTGSPAAEAEQEGLAAMRALGLKAMQITRPAAVSPLPAAEQTAVGGNVSDRRSGAAGPAVAPTAQRSGLLAAAAAGDADAVESLLKRVAPDAERDAQGRTALALAVLRSDSRSVSLLLAHGADRHRADLKGQTPLDEAIRLADPAVLKALGLP
jgi:hypothetical protein